MGSESGTGHSRARHEGETEMDRGTGAKGLGVWRGREAAESGKEIERVNGSEKERESE